MRIIPAELADVLILSPDMHKDHRGFFVETWRDAWGGLIRLDAPFIQDNHVRSEQRGVVRGLHFQKPPHAQAKLIWVTRGAVFDALVDLRKGSPTYGRSFSLVLSEENALRLLVPKGFAHGYMTLEEGTEAHYKVNAYYKPDHDAGIRWDDPALGIAWPDITPVLSEKDAALPLFADVISPFLYAA
ncbi:MAG: dTDP-4-dehydrorhamnose 3,5-epimerase [Desulfovibrio sp.]|jgi:dTDP-4-dehydrorhamnose 3,5-epimerase|nr:dTDP-4-dehydrorhamnose 3,5-epimerase [Desulfovibrio sp.]